MITKLIRTVLVAASVFVLIIACGVLEKKDDEDKDPAPTDTPDDKAGPGTLAIPTEIPIDLTEYSLKSMPTIKEAGVANPGSLEIGTTLTLTADAVGNTSIQSIFKFECYWGDPATDPNSNYCPDPITKGLIDGSIQQGVSGQSKGKYEFSDGALIGMIHHAKSYFAGGYQYNDDAVSIDPATVAYKGTQDENKQPVSPAVDASRYIVQIDDFFNLYKKDNQGLILSHAPKDENDNRMGTAPTMKYFNGSENNIYQSYLRMDTDGESPRAYGLNNVKHKYGDSCNGTRIILLINYSNDRFILKMGGDGSATVIAGKGGFDFATNTWKEGSYYAHTLYTGDSNPTPWQECVDNKTQTVLSSSDICTEVAGLFDGSTFDPGAFLDFDDTEKADLKNFLDFVKNKDNFTADQVPSVCSDAKYFADEIEYTEVKKEE